MKNIYANPRPFMVFKNVTVKDCDSGYGNPSGHSFSSVSVYLAFYHIMTDIKFFKDEVWRSILRFFFLAVTLTFVVLIMFSRFYLGVHSLNQLIFGASCGFCLYYFYFFVLCFHEYSSKEFFDQFYKVFNTIVYSCVFIFFTALNIILYTFNTHNTSYYNAIVDIFCSHIPLYRRFDNEAGIVPLTLCALIGAYYGLLIIVYWRNSIYGEGDRYEELDNWNVSSDWKKFIYRVLLTLFLGVVVFTPIMVVSSNSSLSIIISLKFIIPMTAAGGACFGLNIYLSISFKISNDGFLVEQGGFASQMYGAESKTGVWIELLNIY
jgi:hypothetical protein